MADTEKTYDSTGSATYTFEFEYLKPSDVKVSVAGVPTSEFTIPPSAPTTIQFNSEHVPVSGAGEIRIYRDTNVDNLEATFYAGSAIKSQDLNDNFNQNLFVTQEAKRDIATAWQDGDDTVHSTETWYTDEDTKIATTKAIQARLLLKQNADTDLTNLSNCQTGGSGALAALTQAEIELLDGVDTTSVTTTKINYLSGVTSDIQDQLDAKQDEDALLTAISGKSFRTSTDGSLTTDSDTEIPSSKVVAAHVTNSISAIGGFEAIDDEDNFPSTIPVAGVIVSIANATGITVDSSGTSTTARTAGNGSDNVTINNFPASLRGGNGENANPFPLPNNTGLLVISTGSNHTYNFHRLLPTTDDVKQLSDDVNDFFARYRIANSAPASNNHDGDLWWDGDNNKMKVYDGNSGEWIDLVTTGETFINGLTASDASAEDGGSSATFNGTAFRFKLTNHPTGVTAAHHIVSRAGVIQKPNDGTSQPSEGFAIDGHDIIFSAPPTSDTNIFVTTLGSALSIGTPADNSVSMEKINATGTASSDTFLRGDGAWEPAGGTITATADSYIAANKPVCLVSGKITEVDDHGSETWGSIEDAFVDDQAPAQHRIAVASNIGKVVAVFRYDNKIYASAGSISGNDITWGTKVELINATVAQNNFGLVYDSSISQFIAYTSTTNNTSLATKTNCKFYRIWITGTDTINVASYQIPDANIPTMFSSRNIFICEGNGNATFWASDGSTNDLKACHISYTTSSLTQSSIITTSLDVTHHLTGAWMPDKSSYIMMTSHSSNSDGTDTTGAYGYFHLITRSSDTYSITKTLQFTEDLTVGSTTDTEFDSTQNNKRDIAVNGAEFAFVWYSEFGGGGTTNSALRGIIGVVDNDDILIGSSSPLSNTDLSDSTRLISTDIFDGQYSITGGIEYDSKVGKYHVVWRGETSSGVNPLYYARFQTDGATALINSATTGATFVPKNLSTGTIASDTEYQVGLGFDSVNGKFIHTWTDYDNSKSKHRVLDVADGTTNLTADNFIGFSASSISNGTTGKINVVGNTTTQSGLTAGSKYYVATDGTLSTTAGTPEVLAGIAISSTKLLIK